MLARSRETRVAPERRLPLGSPQRLRDWPSRLGRLKTGTPPRLDGRTIDWASLEMQSGDDPPEPFSSLTQEITRAQIQCGITRTTNTGHALIRANLHRAPIYTGDINGRGPRYCPSIEDKVVRFGDREGHQIFLEPEGLDDDTIYPNGISTSLPADVQAEFISTIPASNMPRSFGRVMPWSTTSSIRALFGLRSRQRRYPGSF